MSPDTSKLNYVLDCPVVKEHDWEAYREADSTARVIGDAEAIGATVLIPEAHELFLDLDTDAQYMGLGAKLQKLNQLFRMKFRITRIVPSNSGLPHRHVTVEGPCDLTDSQRAGLQLYLGSDPVREVLCLRRCLYGIENPTIFVEGGDWKKGK